MASVKTFPRAAEAPKNERFANVIDMMTGLLTRCREGEFRSVCVSAVSDDGKAIPTFWSCEQGDISTLIGHLAVLQIDLATEGRGN